MNEELYNTARNISIISVILNIATIFVSQFAIPYKHLAMEQDGSCCKIMICSQMFEFDMNSLDVIFISVTLFSIIIDLPANLMLIFGLKCKVSWLFLPWLVSTSLLF